MKFLNFIRDTQARLGALRDDGSILDLTSVWPDVTRPDSVDALIQGGESLAHGGRSDGGCRCGNCRRARFRSFLTRRAVAAGKRDRSQYF